jgi:hypothetical protein
MNGTIDSLVLTLKRSTRYTRSKRSAFFRHFLDQIDRPIDRLLRLLDLGGTVRFWGALALRGANRVHITLINNHWLDKTNFDYESLHSFIEDRQAGTGRNRPLTLYAQLRYSSRSEEEVMRLPTAGRLRR